MYQKSNSKQIGGGMRGSVAYAPFAHAGWPESQTPSLTG